MKRILILIPSFSIGGTNSSLLSLLNLLDPKELDVDIFSLRHIGQMRGRFPNCHILDEDVWLSMTINDGGRIKGLINCIIQNARRVFKRIGIDAYPFLSRMASRHLHTSSYDAVCSFQEDLSHLLSTIPAKKRIAWVRCEYERYYATYKKDETSIYDKIN